MLFAQTPQPAVTTVDQLQAQFQSDVQKMETLQLKLQNITEFQQYQKLEQDMQQIRQQAADLQKKQVAPPKPAPTAPAKK